MDLVKSIILGIVEGITEYLPVSSTGHLIIFGEWISFNEQFAKVFDIFIQSGAILAALIVFWKDVLGFSSGAEKVFDNWKKLFVAFLPSAFVGLLLSDFIQEKLFNSFTVAIALILGGAAIIFIDKKPVGKNTQEEKGIAVSYKQSLYVGLAQCLALVPGVSRSASTIIGGMLGGLNRKDAAKFSFLLAIPTLGAASVYSLFKHWSLVMSSAPNIVLLACGFVSSFLVAYLVIRWFIYYLQRNNFTIFGWYRIGLGLAILVGSLLLK
jgi:undecaprenyl-diphosphatase